MAKVLLTTSAAPFMSVHYTGEKRPPLGLGFLISVLKREGHEVFFIDNYLRPSHSLESGYLTKNKIDIVGIYASTICYGDTRRMISVIQGMRKRGIWNGKIVVGGPHTSVGIETIPEAVDHIVVGEGEAAILDIVEGEAGRIVVKDRIKDLDRIPMPAYDYFSKLPYDFGVKWFPDRPVFSMNTSRGCPFRCSFCSVSSVWGKAYRSFSIDRILAEVKYLVETFGARGVYFREDNFTVNRKRVWEFCEKILADGVDIKWVCESRVNTIDRDLIKLMHRAGCRALYLGVESGSQRLLNFMKKDITIEQVEKVFRWCHQIGMKTAASFIVGVPTESEKERQSTVKFAESLKPTTSWFNVFVGVPKSELYDYVLSNGLVEYVDDLNILYLKGHDGLVDRWYGGDLRRKIPTYARRSQIFLEDGNRKEAIKCLLKGVTREPVMVGKAVYQCARSLSTYQVSRWASLLKSKGSR